MPPRAIPHPAHVLRMDEVEAEALAGRPLPERTHTADFAEELIRDGAAQIVIIARGAVAPSLRHERRAHFCRAAEVPVKSKTGAGDSFLAAFTLALAQAPGRPPDGPDRRRRRRQRRRDDRGDRAVPRRGCAAADRRLPLDARSVPGFR
ncbi:MAG: PfkB family carbohydrate kinase [Defluviimonas denitrificans]